MDAFELGPGDVALVNDPFRGGTHFARHHSGRSGFRAWRKTSGVLSGESRASC
jgi:hypothetical protein